jgi:glycosyltransferase involved in cell wall biosynthesis
MNGLAAWIVHKLRSVPVYLDSDDYEAVNNRFGGHWQQKIVRLFEDWLPSIASGITVNTTFIAERFKRLGYPADRIVLVPNGADRERFACLDAPNVPHKLAVLRRRLELKDHHRVVVYVGSMSLTSHAIDLLLEAFVLICERKPDAFLLLVGAGEDLGYLERLAHQLGIDRHVCFVGRVPASEVPLYYRLGEVTADPMRDTVMARSSLSLKLIESIAAGVPCVTADIGDRRAMIGEAGLAVPPDDAEALADGLLTILRSSERAVYMRNATKKLRESYWWETRVRNFIRVYAK